MYIDGLNFRRIARFLNVHHQRVINWVNAYAEELPDAPLPERTDVVEMDELYTYIGEKKNRIYLITFVDRETKCIIGWHIDHSRSGRIIQDILNQSLQANRYFSDLHSGYQTVLY